MSTFKKAGILLVTVFGLSCAQSFNITGTVVDSSTSQGISDATVKLAEYPQITAKTTSTGNFTLTGTATAILSHQLLTPGAGRIELKENSVSFINITGSKSADISVFESNGSQIASAKLSLAGQRNKQIRSLWKTPGLYLLKIIIDGRQYTSFSNGFNSISIPITFVNNYRLAKSKATYTLQVTASGYTSKDLTATSTTANVGTIKLSLYRQPTGVWTNVTPDGILVANEYGVQDILTDPARPSDLYAFTCLNGVWKSTDYGIKWAKISTKGGPLDHGRAWGEAIDKNPNRNPSTPPRMYACQGYGSERGTWVSTDGGVNWTRYLTGGSSEDVYNFDTDPNNCMHVICGMHGDNHCYESRDGGVTWKDKGAIAGDGKQSDVSPYVWFITSDIWLAVSQSGNGSAGTFRTTNQGTSWSSVVPAEHAHGANQIFTETNGSTIYLPHDKGISKSTDYGATWTTVSTSQASVIVGTVNYLYCGYGFPAIGYTFNTNLLRSSRSNGTAWTSYTTAAGMTNGPKRGAVTFDGTHYVIVFGNWCGSGIWRYVEP